MTYDEQRRWIDREQLCIAEGDELLAIRLTELRERKQRLRAAIELWLGDEMEAS
jgi:hypothetical protein